MAAFTTNLSGTTELDHSLVSLFAQAYLIAVGQNNVMDPLVQYREDIGAKSIALTKYARLAAATTPLTETDDVVSSAMSDTQIVLTPAEYGQVITTTNLASLQTGGKADLGAAELVGINHAETLNALAVAALEASGNGLTIGDKAAGDVLAGDVMSGTFMNRVYNKLARSSVPMFDGLGYVAVMHDDVIGDLRAGAAAGDWTDVNKYTDPSIVLRNEVGFYKGFRIVRNNACAFADQAGAGTVDLYKSSFFGKNALGKATSQTGRLVISGPFDKLGRFVNIGWYEVSKYQIVDTDAVWVGTTASSFGANAA